MYGASLPESPPSTTWLLAPNGPTYCLYRGPNTHVRGVSVELQLSPFCPVHARNPRLLVQLPC